MFDVRLALNVTAFGCLLVLPHVLWNGLEDNLAASAIRDAFDLGTDFVLHDARGERHLV